MRTCFKYIINEDKQSFIVKYTRNSKLKLTKQKGLLKLCKTKVFLYNDLSLFLGKGTRKWSYMGLG